MSRIKRRRRVRCKLPCEIVLSAKKRIPGRVVTLSEGGLAVISSIGLDQGDPIRLIIDPKGARPIRVSAIVWNDTVPRTASGESRLRRLGCVISAPSDTYSALLGRMLPEEADGSKRVRAKDHTDTIPVLRSKPRPPVADDSEEADLPRSRELQPPPKVEPEESLPYFRIRLKQIGGPRTRIMTIQARSSSQAEQRALAQLSEVCSDSDGWGVLHVAKVASSAG